MNQFTFYKTDLMKNYFKFIFFFFSLAFAFPCHAQNVLDNLQLKEQIEIYFESSKFNLTDEATQQLQQAVSKYKENTALKLRITAHTDGQGTSQSNYILADKRANAVKYFMISKGVPPDALVASTFGQDKPKADNDSEYGRKLNRRATVEIYEPAPEKVKVVVKQVVVEKPMIQTQTIEKVVEVPTKLTIQEENYIEDAKPYLKGVIRNGETGTPVQSTIYVKHANGKVDELKSEENGTFKLLCVFDEPVTIDVFAKGYFYGSQDAIVTRNAIQKIELLPVKVGNIATISNLYFEGDAPTLLKTSDAELAKILRFMQLNRGIQIEIAGHVNAPGVDPDALPKEEFDLSTERANTIRNFLIDHGFSNEKITAKGYGNSMMRYPEPTSERQEELNRRVEIKILGI
jgi:outer membrane protein OmpA-like peptidoglycan-associated protein